MINSLMAVVLWDIGHRKGRITIKTESAILDVQDCCVVMMMGSLQCHNKTTKFLTNKAFLYSIDNILGFLSCP